jgi:isopentenyl-diphosphate delta-isomerase
MLEHPEARESFALRRYAPTALLFANLGAVQLNYGYGLEHCRRAVEALDADGLYLHLNPLLELIQPEGDTNFAGLAEKIAPIARDLGKPVILKEVGAGLGPDEARLALGSGVRYLDVAGAGGTSWSRIEHHRHPEAMDDGPGLLFQDWGIPTPRALMQLSPLRDRLTLIASGGLRNGVDMVKSMILGGSLCGLAAPFLQPAMDSVEAVLALIERLRREFTMTMFLLGIERAELLVGNDALLLT